MKKITIRIIIVLGILFVILKGAEFWLERNFKAKINSNPDRAYNITYQDFNLHTFFKGVTLDKMSIQPLKEGQGTVIKGNVDYATLEGLAWADLLFGKRLYVRKISFEQPVFEITLSADTIKRSSGKGLQEMFGDILSRADLNTFSIQNGSVLLKEPQTGTIKGQVKNVNIVANDIEIDSVQLKNIIPFYMGNLIIDIKEASYELNEYTHLSLGGFTYVKKDKEMILRDISLGYSIDWVEVSKQVGIQIDIIEFDLDSLVINQLDPSDRFYSDLDIEAQTVSMDGLNIKLQRNKNFSRPPDAVKPMFNAMINSIPLALELDTIHITNSSVTYSELGVKKDESGTIEIKQINGSIINITNIPELQQNLGQLDANFTANLSGHADMKIGLTVPYDREAFYLDVELGEMVLSKLNPTLKPLAGVEIMSGQLARIKYHMSASANQSQNKLVFDYSNLHINMIKELENNRSKKRLFLSAVANAAIRNDNLPGQEKYQRAEYQSEPNIYRSPVNYIIQGLMQGIGGIVPGKNVQKALAKEKKKKKNKK